MGTIRNFLQLCRKGLSRPAATRRFLLEATWTFWERFGFHVVPDHFYYPIPNTKDLLERDPWETNYPTTGIEMREEAQLELLDTLSEFFPEYRPGDSDFESHGDGAMLHGMVRHLQPETVIEVGSGTSTRITSEAIEANDQDAEIRAIEPYPSEDLLRLSSDSDDVTVVESKVEEIPVEYFQDLQAGDILFIDSTHVLTAGNDVAHLYLRVLPHVPEGVYVHAHDIRYPQEYPREWLVDSHFFWSEQYLLQAFLAFNDDFTVLWAGNHMSERHEDVLAETLPNYSSDGGWPGSFWFKRDS